MSPRLEGRRIAVVGTSCSGKTTLSRQLARLLGIDHVELDALHHLPDWEERPAAELRGLVAERVATEAWVVDGNYARCRDLVLERATDLVWLNLPFLPVLGRAIRRTTQRAISREELFSGNRETWRRALSADSMVLWVIRTHGLRRRQYRALFQQIADRSAEGGRAPNLVELRSRGDVTRFVAAMGDDGISPTP